MVINYGAPSEFDTLVQQLGRAGHDGSFSQHILLYNRKMVRNCDADVLSYIRNVGSCNKKSLCSIYCTKLPPSKIDKCKCCRLLRHVKENVGVITVNLVSTF